MRGRATNTCSFRAPATGSPIRTAEEMSGCCGFMRTSWMTIRHRAPFRKLFVLPSAIASEDYGVQDVSYTVIPATDFRPFDSATGYAVTGSGGVNRTGGGTANFAHAINLPAGAILVDMTTYLSDTNATSDVR